MHPVHPPGLYPAHQSTLSNASRGVATRDEGSTNKKTFNRRVRKGARFGDEFNHTHRIHALVKVNIVETSTVTQLWLGWPADCNVLKRLTKERLERGLVRLWVDVAYKDEAVKRVRRGGRSPSPRVGCIIITASLFVLGRVLGMMHLGMCVRVRDRVNEGLFVQEVFAVESVPACLGNRPQPILVRFLHDLRRILVCGDAFPRPRTTERLGVRFGRQGDEGVPFTFGYIPRFVEVVSGEGDSLDRGAWFRARL